MTDHLAMKYLSLILFFSAFSVFSMEQSLYLQGTVAEQVLVSEPEIDVDQGTFTLGTNSNHSYKVYVTENGKKQEIEPKELKIRGRGPASRGPASGSKKLEYRFSKGKGKNRLISIEAI